MFLFQRNSFNGLRSSMTLLCVLFTSSCRRPEPPTSLRVEGRRNVSPHTQISVFTSDATGSPFVVMVMYCVCTRVCTCCVYTSTCVCPCTPMCLRLCVNTYTCMYVCVRVYVLRVRTDTRVRCVSVYVHVRCAHVHT